MLRLRRRRRDKQIMHGSNSMQRSRRKRMLILVLLVYICQISTTTSSTLADGQLEVSPCVNRKTNHMVAVTKLQLLCASKGSFYHEEGSYKKSTTCVHSDRAKLYMLCTSGLLLFFHFLVSLAYLFPLFYPLSHIIDGS